MALCIYREKANSCPREGHSAEKMEGQETGGYHTADQVQDRANHRVGSCGSTAGGVGGGQEDMSLNFASRDEIHQMKGLGVGRWKGGDGGGSHEAIPGRGTCL